VQAARDVEVQVTLTVFGYAYQLDDPAIKAAVMGMARELWTRQAVEAADAVKREVLSDE